MNKKLIIIIGILLVVVIIAGILIFKISTGSLNVGKYSNSVNIKGYNISIDAKKEEVPSGNEAKFRTSFTKVDGDHNKNTYYVDFKNVFEYEDGVVYDMVPPDGTIKINGKEFNYYLDSSGWEASLYYSIPKTKGELIIEIKGGNIYAPNGSQLKTLATVNEKVLQSKELAEVLKFNVSK